MEGLHSVLRFFLAASWRPPGLRLGGSWELSGAVGDPTYVCLYRLGRSLERFKPVKRRLRTSEERLRESEKRLKSV